MKNYVGSGKTINVTAVADITSGDFVVVGSLFGFAAASALTGEKCAIEVIGEFSVTKTAGVAWTEGEPIYWDSAAESFCTTSTSGHTKVGVATAAAALAATTGVIRLNGTF